MSEIIYKPTEERSKIAVCKWDVYSGKWVHIVNVEKQEVKK